MKNIAQMEKGPIEYLVVGQGPAVLVLNGGHTNCNCPFGHEQFFLDQGYQLVSEQGHPAKRRHRREISCSQDTADCLSRVQPLGGTMDLGRISFLRTSRTSLRIEKDDGQSFLLKSRSGGRDDEPGTAASGAGFLARFAIGIWLPA